MTSSCWKMKWRCSAVITDWLVSQINDRSVCVCVCVSFLYNTRQNEGHHRYLWSLGALTHTHTHLSVFAFPTVSVIHPVIPQACGQCIVGTIFTLCVCVCGGAGGRGNYRRLRFLKVAGCPRWHGGQGTAMDHSLLRGHEAPLGSSVTVSHRSLSHQHRQMSCITHRTS